MVPPPKSMVNELAAWNDGTGISLESWVGCTGNFRLAVGYSTVFWPNFVQFEDYIFRENVTEQSVRGFEAQCQNDKRSVECVINHLHIADLHPEHVSEDMIVFLGRTLKEVWQAKLQWQFPDRPCEVSFQEPEDRNDLVAFELSFWQKKHEQR